jgi:hypothetical protein
VSLYLIIAAVVPVVVAFGSGARGRLALAVTIAATWAVALLAYERLVPDRDEISDMILFFTVYVHVITAPVAGTIASMVVPRSKSLVLPSLGALLGSAAAVVLQHVLPVLFDDDRVSRALDVMGPVFLGSSMAVVVASINKKPPAVLPTD